MIQPRSRRIHAPRPLGCSWRRVCIAIGAKRRIRRERTLPQTAAATGTRAVSIWAAAARGAAVGGGSARPTHTSADRQRKQGRQRKQSNQRRRRSSPPPMRGSVGSSLRAPQQAPGGAAPPPPSRHVEDVQDVPERNIHFNVMTQQNEYRSDERDIYNMPSSSDDSPPPPPPPQRRSRMRLIDGGTWMIEPGSQQDC